MTDTIKLYEPNGNLYTTITNQTNLTLTMARDGSVSYPQATGSVTISMVEAIFQSSSLTLTIDPQQGADAPRCDAIIGEAFPATPGAAVNAGVSWESSSFGSSQHLVMQFTKPGPASNDQYEWIINDEVPTLQLRVKIRKQ